MGQVLIIGGTAEGRGLAEFCSSHGIRAAVCVATEYGEGMIEGLSGVRVISGRKDGAWFEGEMAGGRYRCVIDASHPYAVQVTEAVREAAGRTGVPYLRVWREDAEQMAEEPAQRHPGPVWVASLDEAARLVDEGEGNVLITTGSKELGPFEGIRDKGRLYARVLPTASAIEACRAAGIPPSHILAMQGPFSRELNAAILRQYRCRFLVTKDSGKAGGYEEKVLAALESRAVPIVVGRPSLERGLSPAEVEDYLSGMEVVEAVQRPRISIVGVGMGSRGGMTREVEERIGRADAYVGSRRVLRLASGRGKPCLAATDPEEIAGWIEAHPLWRDVAVLMSGDTGFYSGARRLIDRLAGWEVEVLPGVCALSYLSSRLAMGWDDMEVVSLHGRDTNLSARIRRSFRVFALTDRGDGLSRVCGRLAEEGLGQVRLYVGEELSYPEERIWRGTVSQAADERFASLCAAVFENPAWEKERLCLGFPESDWERGRVPMTKAEVRAVSIGKLGLTRDAVVYDVGAGTGSMSVEMARWAVDGQVYAFERSPEGLELIRQNCRRFGVANVTAVAGEAPESFAGCPAPTHACIGGSGGRLFEVVGCLLERNPAIRMVIHGATLETAGLMARLEREFPLSVDLVQLQVSRARQAGNYHLMQGENPVLLAVADGRDKADR